MADLLVAPSALLAAVTVLRSGLASRDQQSVFTKVPADRKGRFVTVSRAGGRRPNKFEDAALLIVQAWDHDPVMGESRAEKTANLCISILEAAAGTTVAGARIWGLSDATSPAWLPDPDSNTPRFQFTGVLTVKTTEHN